MITLAAVSALVFATAVNAHGSVFSFAAAGKEYPSFAWYDQDKLLDKTPVRVADYGEPIYDINSKEFVCGWNARKSKLIAEVKPGDVISWGWKTGDDQNWTHYEGTERVFLASCEGDCSTADETKLQWFELKSLRRGKKKGTGIHDGWAVKTLNDGGRWDDVLPEDVPNGDFLIRDELTAYHYSNKPYGTPDEDGHGWGMEYYPACAAIRISGGKGDIPINVMLMNNGAYDVNQDGHYNPDLWSGNWEFRWADTHTWARQAGNTNNNAGGSKDDNKDDESNNSGTCKKKRSGADAHKRRRAQAGVSRL